MESSDIIENRVKELITFCLKNENTILRRNNIDEYKKICMNKFSFFHENYPTLFFLIIENPSTFPIYRLNEMLNLKQKFEENSIDEKKASVELGKRYYNELVKDTVKELDKQKNFKKEIFHQSAFRIQHSVFRIFYIFFL